MQIKTIDDLIEYIHGLLGVNNSNENASVAAAQEVNPIHMCLEKAKELKNNTSSGKTRAQKVLSHGPVDLNLSKRTASFNKKAVEVSRREFTLLQIFLEAAGEALSKKKIMEALYGKNHSIRSAPLEVHVSNLRKKFGNDFIRTINGYGYSVE